MIKKYIRFFFVLLLFLNSSQLIASETVTFLDLDAVLNNTQKGKSEREIVVSVISKIAETQAKPDGIYTAGDVIFEIKNQAVSQIIAE